MNIFTQHIDDFNNQSRQLRQKRKIIALLNKTDEELTIPKICEKVRLSIPTGTKLINELLNDKILLESGKKETNNGRRPVLLKVSPDSAYSVGVIILLKGIFLTVYDLEMSVRHSFSDEDFLLENSTSCLDAVVSFIKKSIEESKVGFDKVLGVGVGITGRVNTQTGYSYNYFNFLEESLVKFFSDRFDFPVYIDNDTHVLGIAEKHFGKARNKKNAFVLNLSRGMGMAIIANGEIVGGEQGFAGEFGHIQLGESDSLCICGKRGCLGTEVGGYTLEQKFKKNIKNGENSLLLSQKKLEQIKYQDILHAALNGDALSISLLYNMGFTLGKALGNIINLLNPKVIIIGGGFTVAQDILTDSIKSGMTHTALSLPLRSCGLVFSETKDAAIKGAGTLVLHKLQLI
ncbi:MAG: ROK family protein [Bacteroidales bacterium]